MLKKIKNVIKKKCLLMILDAMSNEEEFCSLLRRKLSSNPFVPNLTREEMDAFIVATFSILQLVVLKRVTDEHTK
jgi:hypothetical protein